ncbi:MAG: hypothetical protein LBM71_05255 [Elusimicrobiota bacterium]|jgi:hypothetical protein|nr:hypothetical protein [Elusimicrobiota bacterium]
MKSKILLLGIFLIVSFLEISAQTIKYVTYFPVPRTEHQEVSSNFTVLTNGNAVADFGSTTATGGVGIDGDVIFQSVAIRAASFNRPTTEFKLYVGSDTATALSAPYDGEVMSRGNFILNNGFKTNSVDLLEVHDEMSVKSFGWKDLGGFVTNPDGTPVAMPGPCKGLISWEPLAPVASGFKSLVYYNFLTCGGNVSGNIYENKPCYPSTYVGRRESCGKCGYRTQTATCVGGAWVDNGWSACVNVGTCEPGTVRIDPTNPYRKQTCDETCEWSSSYCPDMGTVYNKAYYTSFASGYWSDTLCRGICCCAGCTAHETADGLSCQCPPSVTGPTACYCASNRI